MRTEITIRLKSGLLDPEGKSIEAAVERMGVQGVRNVHVSKLVELDLPGDARESGELAQRLAEELLANPVIEDYEIRVIEKKAVV